MSNDVFALVEHRDGKVAEISFELLGKGRELAASAGGRLVAVVLADAAASIVPQLGAADSVVAIEHPALAAYTPDAYKRTLAAVLKAREPALLLVGNTAVGMDQAAGLSGELGWPLAAYVKEATLSDGSTKVVSQIYGGKILAEAELGSRPAILSMLAGASPAEKGRAAGAPPVERIAPPALDALRTRFKRLIVPESADVDITKEPMLVSIGRGIQSQDNLSLVEELAEALGAAVSSSRPIVDQGWLPKTRQVGKSGMSVKPKLYLAIGISGAPEHLEGMRGAELIVAINTDAAAPIFNVAHYGVVGDLFDIVPKLTAEIKKRKQPA